MNNIPIINAAALLGAALLWGTTFVFQSTGGEVIAPFTFNFTRLLMGAIILYPIASYFGKRSNKITSGKKLWKAGGYCGLIIFFATNLQQIGITWGTSAGKAGFLTACYIVLVPISGLFLHRSCSWNVWLGVIFAVIGLYYLCLNEQTLDFAFCDVFVILSAICFAMHIHAIDHFVTEVNAIWLSCAQFTVSGLLSGIPMIFLEMNSLGFDTWFAQYYQWQAWEAMFFSGICSSGIAYTLQIVGQQNMDPTIASLLMSFESVFAVIAGWAILGDILQFREIIGCILIFIAVITAQLPIDKISKLKI